MVRSAPGATVDVNCHLGTHHDVRVVRVRWQILESPEGWNYFNGSMVTHEITHDESLN